MTAPNPPLRAPAPAAEDRDGRRRRGRESRARILEALLALIRAGEVEPRPADVAAAAGVGLRTVFRHFDDLEGLYREMAEIMEAQILPTVMLPFRSPPEDWRGRLGEQMARRATAWEMALPYRISADARRHRSPVLQATHARALELDRRTLHAILPPSLLEDRVTLAALELALSFDAWRRLRRDQGLSPEAAAEAVRHLVGRLLADRS